jgi:hypothetical protein
VAPKEILRNGFEAAVSPELARLGFEFSKSRFEYRRKVGVFVQQISIILNQRNTLQHVSFWSAFNVLAPDYAKWLEKMGRPQNEIRFAGAMDWNIPGWGRPGGGAAHDFAKAAERDSAVEAWLQRCVSIGIPFLDSISSWEGLADNLVNDRRDWDIASDFCLIGGNVAKAVRVLNAGIEYLQKEDFSYSDKAHPILVAKRKRQEAQRDQEVEILRNRLNEIENRTG